MMRDIPVVDSFWELGVQDRQYAHGDTELFSRLHGPMTSEHHTKMEALIHVKAQRLTSEIP